MAGVALEDVTKVYAGGTRAVSDLSLDVADGELMVLVGPSGCGKTTALRMIAGLEDISAGTIRIGDRVVNSVPPRDRDVAMVFQSYALYPHLSVADNIAFGLKLRRMPKPEIARRVREAADILGLADLLDRKPKALSGGQRQRVAMGRAIVREPQVFLMDEPLSNLDAKLRVQMRSEILRIQQDLGVTAVYVTHDQVEAMTMGDRVAVLRGGELQQVAAPRVLYDDPVNLFVAGFIGSPAMNMVPATLAPDGAQTVATFGSTRLALPDKVLDERPALRQRPAGQPVVIGIRPESMEDAAVATGSPGDRRISARVGLVEELGAETIVHVEVDAPPVEGLDAETTAAVSDFVARVSPRTRARAGEPIELTVDTEQLHFFDPDTGLTIR